MPPPSKRRDAVPSIACNCSTRALFDDYTRGELFEDECLVTNLTSELGLQSVNHLAHVAGLDMLRPMAMISNVWRSVQPHK